MKVDYTTRGVCAKRITFELDGGKLHDVKFFGGCPGNLAAVVAQILRGNDCGGRGTSCADQLACAIDEALAQAS